MSTVYKVGDLKRIIRESATKNEFKAVYGNGVQNGNKEINRQAYNDIKKEISKYDGGLSNGKKDPILPAENKGMSDIVYDNVDKTFKDRVKSQLKGFTSADAEKKHKNDDFGNAFYGDDKQVKCLADHAKEVKKQKDDLKSHGLTASTRNKTDIEKGNETMFESKKMKNLKFKNTEFLSEGHMLTKVPDDYKTDGNKFMMSDSKGNSYIVEWHKNEEPDVEKKLNKQAVNEELSRIKNLYGYKSKEFFHSTTPASRINENKEFSDMINKARNLMK